VLVPESERSRLRRRPLAGPVDRHTLDHPPALDPSGVTFGGRRAGLLGVSPAKPATSRPHPAAPRARLLPRNLGGKLPRSTEPFLRSPPESSKIARGRGAGGAFRYRCRRVRGAGCAADPWPVRWIGTLFGRPTGRTAVGKQSKPHAKRSERHQTRLRPGALGERGGPDGGRETGEAAREAQRAPSNAARTRRPGRARRGDRRRRPQPSAPTARPRSA
jgi:hypothetical protein